METRTRKQRYIRQREAMFLDSAYKLLFSRGYHGLTMDRIAKATGYSRGTIYLHFGCKEDIVIALVNRGLARRLSMLERAAAFRGRSRERMQALGEAVELFARLYPDDMRLFHIGNAEAITQRASEKLLYAMKNLMHRSMNVAAGIVRDGIAQGDLAVDSRTTPEEITFSLWATTDGGYALSSGSGWIYPAELGIPDAFAAVMRACEILCDGYEWRPLSSEWDSEETRRRIREEIFPEETAKVYGKGSRRRAVRAAS